MQKTIAQLRRGFESSCGKTPEFKAFCRTFKSEFKKVLTELSCTDLECSNGHFYISGFFNAASGQTYYFNTGDVRGMCQEQLLVRTAEHRKDYRGGGNRYARLHELIIDIGVIIKK